MERSLLIFFVTAAIIAVQVWHVFAHWFVNTVGIVPGLGLLLLVLIIAALLDPYWED